MRPTDLARPLAITAALALAVGLIVALCSASLSDDAASAPDIRASAGSARSSDDVTIANSAVAEQAEANRTAPPGDSGSSADGVPQGRIDPAAKTLGASPGCEPVPVQAHGENPSTVTMQAPPVPRVSARRKGDTILVSYELLAMPEECEPVAISIIANSVDKLGNVSSASNDGGPLPLDARSATVELPVPAYGPPPYEAKASVYTREGLRSPVTTVSVQ